jgi:DNA-binding GntR family transcriptional regulator
LADHEEIYERVAERDAEGAERAMIDHLTRVNVQGRRRSGTKTRRWNSAANGRVSRKQRRKL